MEKNLVSYYQNFKIYKRRYLSASIVLKESNVEREKRMILKIVFERLNTGGIKLSQQEIRNALNSGELK